MCATNARGEANNQVDKIITSAILAAMGSSSSAPKISASQKKSEALQMQLMKAQLKAAQKPIEMPHIAVPPPARPPAPPPSASGADVLAAGHSARRQASRRTGAGATLFAGALGGQRTLLGSNTPSV